MEQSKIIDTLETYEILVVTMGYYIDSLDVCFGTQLADFRGDIGVIYA